MAFSTVQAQGYQNNQQLMLIGVTVFGSIVAAVVVSALVVMSLLRGEIANAASQAQTPTQTIVAGPGLCAASQAQSGQSHQAGASNAAAVGNGACRSS